MAFLIKLIIMRTVQTKITTVKGDQKYITTKTITYMKVGDLIGTAKTAYDLGKVYKGYRVYI